MLGRNLIEITEAKDFVESHLDKLKLKLKPSKTHFTNFEKGFEFLGACFTNNSIIVKDKSKEKHILPKDKHRLTIRQACIESRSTPMMPFCDGDARFDSIIPYTEIDNTENEYTEEIITKQWRN